MNLKDKTVRVIDNGLFVELAIRLLDDFGTVEYFSPFVTALPLRREYQVGVGLGLNRVDSIFENIDDVDLFVFCDLGYKHEQKFLRESGFAVLGMGDAEEMEIDRFMFRQMQEELGMDTPETEAVTGIKELREAIKGREDKVYIKISRWRGLGETMKNYGPAVVENWFKELAWKLGPLSEEQEFLIEEKIDGVEWGSDIFTMDGQYPSIGMYGIENKDAVYMGKIVPYSEFPEVLTRINTSLAPVFKDYGSKGFWSTESRITKKKESFVIDMTIRAGSPPMSAEMEMYSNFGEMLWGYAHGELVTPIPKYKYCCISNLLSEYAVENWCGVYFDKKYRRNLKFRSLTQINGEYHICPHMPNPIIGSANGWGNTLESAIKMCKEANDSVQAMTLDTCTNDIDSTLETIKESKSYGVSF